MELCGWGLHGATSYTYGAPVPGLYMPDLERAGCILFWGYNPNLARLSHAVATTDALRRGAKLIVVDPRRTGPASKADLWLRVRPGTDGALALGIAGVMIERGWYDRDFIRAWTDGPLLVRDDDGARQPVAWDRSADRPVRYDPAGGEYADGADPALTGQYDLDIGSERVRCRPVFERVAELCRAWPPERVEAICGVPGIGRAEGPGGAGGRPVAGPGRPGCYRCRRFRPRWTSGADAPSSPPGRGVPADRWPA